MTTHDKAVGGEREEEGEGEKYPRASNEDDKTALLHRVSVYMCVDYMSKSLTIIKTINHLFQNIIHNYVICTL